MFKLIKRILDLSGEYKNSIKAAFIFSVLKAMLSQMPVFVTYLVLLQFNEGTMTPSKCIYAGISLVVIVLLGAFTHLMSDKLQSTAGYMTFADKRMELGAHLKKFPMGYFTSGNIGKISSVLSTDMIFIEEVSMSMLADMMSYMFNAVLMVIFMFVLNVRLGIIAVLFDLLIIVLAEKMDKLSIKLGSKRQEQSEGLVKSVLSFAEGIGIIKSYNLLGEKSKELSNNFIKSRDTALEFEHKLSPWLTVLNVIYGIGTTALFAFGIYLQQIGEIPLPYLLGMLMFVFSMFDPIKSLYGQSSRLTVMNSCIDRIEQVFNEKELTDNGRTVIPERIIQDKEVSFEDVSFAYDKKDVLSNITFDMKKNSMTALVGPSGSGKSTIANLLTRFWDVNSGAIKIRGMDIRKVPLADLMEHISMVFQSVYLFEDTIFNNISMGKKNATKQEVYEAAKKARCYDFIQKLPDGFNTIVGEGGATLSGGEKQRISIARCILKDAPIVILDEATASVDTDNESYIQEAISELVKGKTLLVIAHRLNTIRSADQILVIDNGQIAERGTHDELMRNDGIYKNFVDIRENASSWSLAK